MFFLLEKKGENLKALQLAIRHWLLQGQKKQMQRLPCEAKNSDLRCLSNSSLP